MKRVLFVSLALAAFSSPVLADSLAGSCKNSSGETCLESNHTISTSWNSAKGYPDSAGRYRIDFGGTVGQRITVYCDGSRVGEVTVSGATTFDVVCR